MTKGEESKEDVTFPVRVAARMTGLKPELIRAWETRYGAIRPSRSAGGSRRYSDEDIRRLRLLRDVVDAGHRIGGVARLNLAELQHLLPSPPGPASPPIDQIIAVVEQLDAPESRRLLTKLRSEQDPLEFARKIVLPLLVEIGRRWNRGDLSISVEHFTSEIVRSILMPVIASVDAQRGASRVVFATPSGEHHDLGTLVAALVAVRAGADVIFLGADVPVDDLVQSVFKTRASAIVLGIVTLSNEESEQKLRDLRDRLPKDVGVWIGGAGIAGLAPLKGIERITNLEQLEAQITLLDAGIADESVPFDSPARVQR
jgi:DNA-binding transcriptional MerR regulator/methylmalonyl-CoA mutase cobalamin-binding subunit